MHGWANVFLPYVAVDEQEVVVRWVGGAAGGKEGERVSLKCDKIGWKWSEWKNSLSSPAWPLTFAVTDTQQEKLHAVDAGISRSTAGTRQAKDQER